MDIQRLLGQLEGLASYVNHCATFQLEALAGEGPLLARIDAAYPAHAPCALVPVGAWREAIETALRWIALDENQLAANRRPEIESVIAQVMAVLDAWLAPFAVACFEVRHASAANGAGLCGYLVDGTHALVLGDGADPAMFVLGIGWSD